MSKDLVSPAGVAALIAEPLSTNYGARRRFFALLQKWRIWLRKQIGQLQTDKDDLADHGTDDLLALALLVQFVRDRAPDAAQSLEKLPRRDGAFTLGDLCGDLQNTTKNPVLKAVFAPAQFADKCILPATVLEQAFWYPIIQASRKLYGLRLPITIFGDLHQWCLTFSPGESPIRLPR